MSALARRAREALESFATAEISSRPLGLLRIFAPLITVYHHGGSWVAFRTDHLPVSMILVWVFMASALWTVVGYKTRWATAIYALSFAVLHMYYGITYDWLRLYKPVQEFQVAVILALVPAGRSLSIDRAIEVNRAEREGREPEKELMPWWMLELFILQIICVYIWAAENKSDAEWFQGARMERYYVHWYGNSDSFVYNGWVHPIAVLLAWATTSLECVLVIGLLIRRTRPYVVWGGFMLHIGILTFLAVTYFSFMMMLILMMCLPPTWIHDFISLVIEDGPGEEPEIGARSPPA